MAPVYTGFHVNSHGPIGCPGTEGCRQAPEIKTLFNGTSAGSPQAAGIAALIRSRYPGLDQQEVRERIENSAETYWELTEQNKKELGAGKVNAYRSLTEWGSIDAGVSVTWSSKADAVAGDLYSKDDIFYVSGDLTIKDGGVLTIKKGLTIRVAPDHLQAGVDLSRVEIVVKSGGTLNIIGDEAGEGVVFESFTDSAPTATDWMGIKFESGSSGDLNHVVIKNAAAGIVAYTPLTIESCRIEDGSDGIETHADVLVENSVINNLTNTGIEAHSGTVTVVNDTISNCAIGIELASSGSAPSANVRDSYIHDIEFWGVSSLLSDRSVTLKRTRIENAFDGVRLSVGTYALIDSCLIKNNDTGIWILADSAPLIKRCVIDSNTTNGIYCQVGSNIIIDADTISNSAVGIYCLNSSPSVQNGNWIKDNASGIKVDGSSDPVVRSTKITSNSGGVLALNGANPDLGQSAAAECTGGPNEGGNSIFQNTGLEVSNLSPSVTIMAECNYWGPMGPKPSEFSGAVDYDPYLTGNPLPTSPGPNGQGKDREDEKERNVPLAYALSSGYPNPFNPATKLRYEVPAPGGLVTVVIYDVQGKDVRTLFAEEKPPGFHSVTWDGKSDRGLPVASGVYFVQMRAKGFRETKKIVLLK